ncbi:hypothetical protein TUM20984_29110 [Mycobacterium antarcticum]|nr:hypothetical protein TUM20984_29110 [Mycolicibacterium sp. TUM20984]
MASDPISAFLAVPVSIVTTLINAVLRPFFGGAPIAPAQPPLLWAVLAWVRRELQRTFANSTPTAPNQNVTVTLTTPTAVSGPVAFAATDADGDPLTYTVPARGAVGGPTHGTVTVDQTTGTFTYDPDDAYALSGGTDTFTYTVSDAGARRNFFGIPLSGSSTTASGTVAVSLNRVDVAPVINGDVSTTVEETPITIAVLGNDTDANGSPLTVSGVTQASHGTTTFTASGVTYAPNANYNGTDSFTYTATDGSLTGTATVTVTVTAVDDVPVAVNDTATVVEDSGTTLIDVLANDTDVDAGPKTITAVTQPAGGTITFTGTTLSYTPNANYTGTDTFTYTLNGGLSATATITVTAVDDAPVAVGDAATVTEDSGTTLINVLGNDTDVDAGPRTIVGVTQPAGGTVTFTGTSLSYTPNANFTGIDTFTYTLAGGSTATVTITVTAVDDAPVAVGDTATVTEDSGTTLIDVLGNDTDVDAGPRTIAGVTQPAGGTVTFTGTSLSYTPNANFTGIDTFTYTLAGGSTATVTIAVAAVDDAPVAVGDTATVTEDSGTTLINVLANDTDVDAGPKTITGVTQPINGVVTFTGSTLRYRPTANFNGTDTFTYTLAGGSTATVTVTVTAVNDAPVLGQPTSTPGVGNTWVISPNASDVDGDTLTTTVTSANGTIPLTVTQLAGGSIQVVVDPTWARAHPGAQLPVTVTVTDSQNATATKSLVMGTASNATAIGINVSGQANIPALPAGVTYTQVAVSLFSTVLLRSDGTAVGVGYNSDGQLDIPQLSAGVTYTQVAAGYRHTVLLRSDGTAIGLGDNDDGQIDIPQLPAGVTYIRIAAGEDGTVLLRSDGTAVGVGQNDYGQLNIPALPAGVTYTQAAVGIRHTVLLRSDGSAVVIGDNSWGQLNIPALPAGVKYTQVAAGEIHTVLLRSDGTAVAVGNNGWGQSTVPALPAGVTYTGVAAARYNSALLRSDGTAVAFGQNASGQLNIPVLPAGVTYTQVAASNHTVLISSATAALNTPPAAVNDAATVAEGGSTTIAVTTNDTDGDGTVDTTTVVITRQPTAGTVTVNAGGTVTYAHNGSEVRTDNFGYKVRDDTGALSNEATVTMTITAVNDAPVAVNDAATVAEGGSTTIAVTTNDIDGDGTVDTTTVVITRQPTAGTATANANGSVTYVNNGSEARTDSFAYQVKDNTGALSNEATVTMTITAVNDAPIAGNDAYTVAGNGTLTINAPGLLANDTDPDGDQIRITAAIAPQHGTLSGLLSNGTFTYTPAANYAGADSFTYTVSDGTATSQGTVTITVTADANNVAPVGNSDSYTIAEDTVLTVNAPGLLGNDTDADGQTLSVVSIGIEPTLGSLELRSDGSFTYTPGPNVNGTDTFTYKASDGAAETAFTTVTITVTAVNDAPVVALNDVIPIAKDSFVAIALANRSSDVDGDVLTGILVTSTQHGTLVFLGDQRAFTYQPTAGYVGQDSFSYKVNDGKVDSAVATVTLNVS